MLYRYCTISFLMAATALAQSKPIVWSAAEKPLYDQIRTLRSIPDNKRGAVTKQLALDVRALPLTPNKVTLADNLADLSTEGDFGREHSRKLPPRWPKPCATKQRWQPPACPKNPTSRSHNWCATNMFRSLPALARDSHDTPRNGRAAAPPGRFHAERSHR